MIMEEHVGKSCPFCNTKIRNIDVIKVCPACGVPHHEGCWKEHGGCMTEGCSEQPLSLRKVKPAMYACMECGEILMAGQAVCTKCGHKADIQADLKDAKIKETLKQPAKKKSGKKPVVIIALIAVVVLAAVAVLFVLPKLDKKDSEGTKTEEKNGKKEKNKKKQSSETDRIVFDEVIVYI